jgi:hypothetical protein
MSSARTSTKIQFAMNGYWSRFSAPSSTTVAIHRVVLALNTRDVHGVGRSSNAWTTRTQTSSTAKAKFSMEKRVPIVSHPTLKWMAILSFRVSLTLEEVFFMFPDLVTTLAATPKDFTLLSSMEEGSR